MLASFFVVLKRPDPISTASDADGSSPLPERDAAQPRKRKPPHLLIGTNLAPWLRVLCSKGGITPKKWGTAAAISACSLLGLPIRWFETARYGSRSARYEFEPVFLIGHWQSGHSPVHYLLAQDPQFGYVSTAHCALPAAFQTLQPLIKRVLKKRLPKNRVADSLSVGIGSPQGDDMGLAGLSELSFYHAYIFPRSAESTFEKAALLEGVSPGAVARWQRTYRRFLGRVAAATGRQRLIARNATNTGRIAQLLEAFPNSRFIHVYRNPYHVFTGTCERMFNLAGLWSLQKWDTSAVREQTLSFYERLMQRYFETRDLIPSENLVEIRYEDFESAPLETMEHTYRALRLGDFAEVREQAAAYLETSHGEPAGQELPCAADVAEITRRWGFSIDRLGYDRLG